MGKQKVCVKQVLSRKKAVAALKDLIKGLESGKVVVGEGDGNMEFGVTDELKVELKGRVKRNKVKVSVSLSWMQDADVPATRPEAEVPAKKVKAKVPAKKEKAKTPAKKAPAKKPAAKKPAAQKTAAPKKAATPKKD